MIKISADILKSLLNKLDQQNIKYIGYFSEEKEQKPLSFDEATTTVYKVLISSEIGQFYSTTKDLDSAKLIKVDSLMIKNPSAEVS